MLTSLVSNEKHKEALEIFEEMTSVPPDEITFSPKLLSSLAIHFYACFGRIDKLDFVKSMRSFKENTEVYNGFNWWVFEERQRRGRFPFI